MSRPTPRLLAVTAFALVLLAAGCKSSTVYSTSDPPPPPSAPVLGSDYVAIIRIESMVKGGGVKVNGFIVSDLPGRVEVETDETGKVLRQYVIGLSTNIIELEAGKYTLEPGDQAPGRIYFDRANIEVSENARVRKTHE